jgi:hypothetical protein
MSELIPESEYDDVGSLLPSEDTPLSPEGELALAESSLDAIDTDDLIVQEEEPPPLGKSWSFDFQRNRFQRTEQAHGPQATSGLRTLEAWIEKCLRTDRGAHPVHSDAYGVDDPFGMIGHPVESALPDDYPDRVTRALLAHPHIADVRRFRSEFDPDDDVLLVSFLVVLLDETAIPFEAMLGATG